MDYYLLSSDYVQIAPLFLRRQLWVQTVLYPRPVVARFLLLLPLQFARYTHQDRFSSPAQGGIPQETQ